MADSLIKSTMRWARGKGVGARTRWRRWVIVAMALALPFYAYGGLVEFVKDRKIDKENVRVTATVLDVVEYHGYGRFGRFCLLTILASFRQAETGTIFYLGERLSETGEHYATVGTCSATPRVAVGDFVSVEYAASDPNVNRLYTETSSVSASIAPLIFAFYCLILGGAILVDRLGNKLWNW